MVAAHRRLGGAGEENGVGSWADPNERRKPLPLGNDPEQPPTRWPTRSPTRSAFCGYGCGYGVKVVGLNGRTGAAERYWATSHLWRPGHR
jgi:hypothetical protein